MAAQRHCEEVGGLVGANLGTQANSPARIRRSSSAVDISGRITYLGGLVGSNGAIAETTPGIVQDSFAGGDVSGRESVGGLVGYNWTGGKIVASYSVGSGPPLTDKIDGGLVGSISAKPAP